MTDKHEPMFSCLKSPSKNRIDKYQQPYLCLAGCSKCSYARRWFRYLQQTDIIHDQDSVPINSGFFPSNWLIENSKKTNFRIRSDSAGRIFCLFFNYCYRSSLIIIRCLDFPWLGMATWKYCERKDRGFPVKQSGIGTSHGFTCKTLLAEFYPAYADHKVTLNRNTNYLPGILC